MRRQIKRLLPGLLPLLVVALLAISVAASGGLRLDWNSVDGGGGSSSGGTYTLDSTIGQVDAGDALSGGGYTLEGGYWLGAVEGERILYLPMTVTR